MQSYSKRVKYTIYIFPQDLKMGEVNVEEKKKAELRKKIEYQVACEERAHRLVEKLIENPISEDILLNSVSFKSVSLIFRGFEWYRYLGYYL